MREILWEENVLTELMKKLENRTELEQSGSMIETRIRLKKTEWKDIGRVNGTYKIVNKMDGKFYIGSSTDIQERFWNHRGRLNAGQHKNPHLQNAVNKYGIDMFEFVVTKLFPTGDFELSLAEEQRLLDEWYGNEMCYNINKFVDVLCGENHPRFGKPHSQETKDKISKSKKGKTPPQKHPMFNVNLYSFENTLTKETFKGTYYDFCKKYNLHLGNVSRMIHGSSKVKSVKKWILL